MLGGIVLLLGGSLGAELFTSRFSLLVLLAGMVLFLAGWKRLRAVSFPLGFPHFNDSHPRDHLQPDYFPSAVVGFALRNFLVGIGAGSSPARRQCFDSVQLLVGSSGSVQRGQVPDDPDYAGSCLRLSCRKAPAGCAMCSLFLMVPIAIVSNAIRIMGTGVLTYHFGPEAAEGFFHEFSGWIIFLAALVLMFVCSL